MTVELPKDAEGREIPLDTALLYGKVSGDEYEVVCFNFSPSMRRWRVKLKRRRMCVMSTTITANVFMEGDRR